MLRFALCFIAASAVDRHHHHHHASLAAKHSRQAPEYDGAGGAAAQITEIVGELRDVALEVRETCCGAWQEYLTNYNNIAKVLFDLGTSNEDKRGVHQVILQLEGSGDKSIAAFKNDWVNKRQEEARFIGQMKGYSSHAKEETNMIARLANDRVKVIQKAADDIMDHKALLVAYANAYVAITKSNIGDTFAKYFDEGANTADYDWNQYASTVLGICGHADPTNPGPCPLLSSQDKNACQTALPENHCAWYGDFKELYGRWFADGNGVYTVSHLTTPTASFIQEASVTARTNETTTNSTFADSVQSTLLAIQQAMSRLSPEHREIHELQTAAHKPPELAFAQGQKAWKELKGTDMKGYFNTNNVQNAREETIANWLLQGVATTDSRVDDLQKQLLTKSMGLKQLEDTAKSASKTATEDAEGAMDAATAWAADAQLAEQNYKNALKLYNSLVNEQADLGAELARVSSNFISTMTDCFDELYGLHVAGSTLSDGWATNWHYLSEPNDGVAPERNSGGIGRTKCGDDELDTNNYGGLTARQIEGAIQEFGDVKGVGIQNIGVPFVGQYVYGGEGKFYELPPDQLLAKLQDEDFHKALMGEVWRELYGNQNYATLSRAASQSGNTGKIQDAAEETGDAFKDQSDQYDAELSCSSQDTEALCVGVASPIHGHYPCIWDNANGDPANDTCRSWSEDLATQICESQTNQDACNESADCAWTANADGGGSCGFPVSVEFLQIGAETKNIQVACDTNLNPTDCHDALDTDNNPKCVWDFPTAGDPFCTDRYAPDPLLTTFVNEQQGAVTVFNQIIRTTRNRKESLLQVLQQLRSNQITCNARKTQYYEAMRGATLEWNEFYARFITAKDAMTASATSMADAQSKVQEVQNQLASSGLMHAKAQASFKSMMHKWKQGEHALSAAINALMGMSGGNFAPTVKLIDALRDRIIRLQRKAKKNMEEEHTEYKKHVRTITATLNAFEAELASATGKHDSEQKRAIGSWYNVGFLNQAADGSAWDQDTNALDAWPIQDSGADEGTLAYAAIPTDSPQHEGDQVPELVYEGYTGDDDDGTLTDALALATEGFLAFDQCKRVAIEPTDSSWGNADGHDVAVGSTRESLSAAAWDENDDASNTYRMTYLPTTEAKDLFIETKDMLWADAENFIQTQVNTADALIGMLKRFEGADQQSNIICNDADGDGVCD